MKNISLFMFKNEELLSIAFWCILASATIYFLFKLRRRTIKSDSFSIILITTIYSIISLWQLGSTQMPTTTWQAQHIDEFITFELIDSDPSFDAIYALGGEGDNNSLDSGYQAWFNDAQVLGSNDNSSWDLLTTLNNHSNIFSWVSVEGTWNYRYISVVFKNEKSVINEIAFRKSGEDQFLQLKPIFLSNPDNPHSALHSIDEQDIVPLTPTYYNSSYFDEIYHPRNAWEIANGQDMYSSVHPLLGTSIMSLGIKLFGMNPFGWRIMGALFGIMILPLFYLIIKKLFNNRFLSTIGTTLFAADFMLITTSRIGTLEPFSVFFILLMTYFMIQYFFTDYTSTSFKKQCMWLALSGVSMGLAISTKWTGCYAAIALALIFFTHFISNWIKYNKSKHLTDPISQAFVREFKQRATKTILFCCVFFVIIPIIIYFIHYLPTRVTKGFDWSITSVLKQIEYMYQYHATLDATHPYQSVWYQWLFDIRPIWYYFGSFGDGIVKTISCFNNPLVTIIGVFTMLYTFVDAIKTKSKSGFIIVVCYLSALLPWVLVTRCVFSYHYYPSLPFLILSIIYTINKLLINYKLKKNIIILYVVLTVLLFFIFLPVLTGFTTTQDYVGALQWLPSWYFGG